MNTSNDSTDQSSADGVSEHSPSAADDMEVLDPHQTALEAAALAAHLHRSGVKWLPPSNLQATKQLASRFAAAEEMEEHAAPTQRSQSSPDGNAPPASGASVSQVGSPAGSPSPQARPASNRDNPNRPPSSRPATRLQEVSAIEATISEYSGESLETDQRILKLKQLEEVVASCTQCPALTSCRNQTVFGEGNPSPRVAFFGEGPGEEEDVTGRPFVGPAGQLLTKMMQACTFERDDVYILNTVKCRPPGNRNPEGDELGNCRTYYQQQFDVLRPEYIVCLGAVSAQELLGSKLSVGRLRGTLHRYFASKVLVTYHPAYLLRNPAAKKAAWADLQLLMRDAGIEPPKR
jgi:uracil-DNA glycosylase family 4